MNREPILPNPNPRLVALLDYAIDEVARRLHNEDEYIPWLNWAKAWKGGEHIPFKCTRVARHYLDKRAGRPINHCLGQLAWAGKEACYSIPTSGWLVVRYIADAMIAFGVAYPDVGMLLSAPTINAEAAERAPQQLESQS